jgi:hypothetical protein
VTRTIVFIVALVIALALVLAVGGHLFSGSRAERVPAAPVVQRQFPDNDENETASRVMATLARFDEAEFRRQREYEVDYLRAEVDSEGVRTNAPPPRLAEFLKKHEPILQALRAQLASSSPPVWKQRANDVFETPQPDQITLNQVSILFAASALAQHAAGHDAAAWSDLGATWVIARSLWARPEISSVLSALTGSRLIAAVSAKLPVPPPPWWAEYTTFDVRPPFARALEYEAWAVHTRAERVEIGEPNDPNSIQDALSRAVEPVVRPVMVLQADAQVRDIRTLARGMATRDPCAPLPEAARARWESTLQRLDRFIIEREGAAKLVAIQTAIAEKGSAPPEIDDRSACRDQHWIYKPAADGFTLSFSGHLPPPQTRIVTPLAYRR